MGGAGLERATSCLHAGGAPPAAPAETAALMGERHSDPSATLLVLARGLHEQGDLDAVVDLELVEESGDMALDRRDGEVQRRGDLGVAVAEADGERDVALARAER